MAFVQVLFSPAAAFASLKDKKWAWVLATVVLIVLSIVSIALTLGKFSVQDIMEYQIAQSGQEMPSQGVGAMTGLVTGMMYGGAIIGTPIFILVLALLLLGIVKAFSGQTSLPRMMNAASYALFAYSVVSMVLVLIMLYTASDLKSYQLENPVPLNAGYFFPPESAGKALSAFLSGINLLNFYFIYLLALGASALSERVKMGAVLWPLAGLYALYVLGKTGFAAIF
jgi:hypothetical protein